MVNIAQAKQQVKDAIEAYLATDEEGRPFIAPSGQRPVFLVGAPGIGKTAIMAQIASELGLGLVSYSMTHHTRQSALGLPFIVHRSFDGFDYDASEYTMSEIIASIYDYMRDTSLKQGILFLDEINCVSETLYPSMLQFLQFKMFGRHKIPDGWIVVTAGNPPEYNKAVHEFDIVTLDRVKRIVVDPDFDAWKQYATTHQTHPAILSFLEIKKDRFYSVKTSLDGKSFVTARGWNDLSDMMMVYEHIGKSVDYDLIVQYVQNDSIAREFSVYYDLFKKYQEDYHVEEILAGTADSEIVSRAQAAGFDERLSLIALMLDALNAEMRSLLDETDYYLEIRNSLREVKAGIDDDADIEQYFHEMSKKKSEQLEARVATNSITEAGAVQCRRVILYYSHCLDLINKSKECNSVETFKAIEGEFVVGKDGLRLRVDEVENKLAHAFAFLIDAFEDRQEVLIFTTELSVRPTPARYIAQYGSDSYYAHNANMILSERQKDLKRRIDEIEL